MKHSLVAITIRDKYFPLSANKHYGIVLEFRAFSEKFQKSYVRKGGVISKISSKDFNKSAALATFEGKNEKKGKIKISPFFPFHSNNKTAFYWYNHSCLADLLL